MKRRKKLSYILLATIVLAVLIPCLALLLSGCGVNDISDEESVEQRWILHIPMYDGSAKDLALQIYAIYDYGNRGQLMDGTTVWIRGDSIVFNGDHCPICEG